MRAMSTAVAVRRLVNPWVVLTLVGMAQFMVVLDATVVNVALPSIKRGLNFTNADLQWIVNAYTLTFGGFLLLGGRAGDLFGRQRTFLAGAVLLILGAVLVGFFVRRSDVADIASGRETITPTGAAA